MLPFFYIKEFSPSSDFIELDEINSKHIVQVLRMKIGDALHLTDGKGHLITAEISEDHRKHCIVKKTKVSFQPRQGRYISLAISLVKNVSRFEWMLEKVTEIGAQKIVPLICTRTEKEKFRFDRMEGICISALLQSKQVWLPELAEPVNFSQVANWKNISGSLFIAHCEEQAKNEIATISNTDLEEAMIAIGPEGDFTNDEISLAFANGFKPLSLGGNRLRTETAGVVAVSLFKLK